MYGRPGARACSGSHLKSSDISLYSVVRTPGPYGLRGFVFHRPCRLEIVLQFTSAWPDLADAISIDWICNLAAIGCRLAVAIAPHRFNCDFPVMLYGSNY